MDPNTQKRLDEIKTEIKELEATNAPAAEIDAKRDEHVKLTMSAMGLGGLSAGLNLEG